MADGTIITGKLDDKQLRSSIDKLVKDVDDKMQDLAIKFDDSVQMMQNSLNTFANSARAKVGEIKNAFSQLGTTFDQFARAMERAASAANGVGQGGNGGNSGKTYASGTIGALEQEIAAGKSLRKEAQLYSDDLKDINNQIERQTSLLNQETKGQQRLTEEAKRTAQAREKIRVRSAISMETNTISEAERKLLRLEGTLQRLKRTRLLDESQINRVQRAITKTTEQLEKLKAKASIPTTMTGIMGMSEKTLNDISLKMRAITQLRAETPVGSADISRLNAEYARLSKMQSEIIGKNATLVESNNALGRAFNYIRNRLAFTLTIGAFTGFVRQLYEIRGQYELLERSLGVLLNSFSKGSQIFNELNAMAIKSPFTLIELGTAAKQLTAYNFTAREVVNTTKRLADISAALGVPMERLVYNLGQIRAQTVLTARDARDFANAGLAIVPELAKYYTELEGKVVTTADVFDRMKKKAVSYNDTMAVINKVTDEGGKFFDFQAKQAGTLRVQLANLNLAWNNMLNDMGKSHQGFLSTPLAALRQLFLHWRSISNTLTAVVAGLGAYKAAQIVINRTIGISNKQLRMMVDTQQRSTIAKYESIKVTRTLTAVEQAEYNAAKLKLHNKRALTSADYELALVEKNLTTNQAMQLVTLNKNNTALHQALINTGLLTRAQVQQARTMGMWSLAMNRAGAALKSFGRTLYAIAANPMTWLMLLASMIAEIGSSIADARSEAKNFAKSISEGAKESFENTSSLLKNYNDVRKQLYGKDGLTSSLSESEAKKTWEEIREQILTTSSASDIFIAKLMSINDVNERLRKAFDYLETIKSVSAALKDVSKDTFDVQKDWSKWWNLGMLPDGLFENVQDYTESLESVRWAQQYYGEAAQTSQVYQNALNKVIKASSEEAETLEGNLNDVYNSMMKFANEKGWLHNMDAINEYFAQVGQRLINEGLEKGWEPADVLNFQLKWEEYRSQAAKKALAGRINDEVVAYNNAEDERTRNAIKAAYDRDKAQLDIWEETNGRGRVLWNEFCKWMNNEHSSEVQAMYNKMTENGKRELNYQSEAWVKWVNDMSQKFGKEHKLSQDDVFKNLKQWVNDANNWKIFIGLTISTEGPDIYETLTDADKAADEAYNKVKRLGQEIDRLRAKRNKATDSVQRSFLDKDLDDTIKAQSKAQKEYDEAIEKGGRSKAAEADAKKRQTAATRAHNAAVRAEVKAESELQKAFREEIQLVDNARKAYKELTKAGMSHQDALDFSTKGVEKSVKAINDVFAKWGIQQLDLSKYAGTANPRDILNMFEQQLKDVIATGKAKPEEIQELQLKIKDIRLDAEKFDMKKITDGLNNELGKIKEEYELAVELDANPELGDMFADMFGIDVDDLPHTFGEAFERANKVAIDKLKKLKKDTEGFDLMSTDINKYAEKQGLKEDSEPVKELLKWQKTLRDVFKKYLTETEKMLDDYVKKYGDYSDKVAQIEHDRLKRIKDLNNAYYKGEMKDRSEYQAKLDAINKGAEREKGAAKFDEFKNSRLYIAMFENLQLVSTEVLKKIREKLVDLRSEMGTLQPEQLKQVVQQFEKIDKELSSRSPFGSLVKNARDYLEATGKAGKEAEKQFVQAQENYDAQMQVVAALKEQLEKKKAEIPLDQEAIILLQSQIFAESEKLRLLKKELEDAQELNDKYNLMKKAFTDQWQQIGKIAQVVGNNLKSLGELRDTIENTFGVDLGNRINGAVDSLMKVGDAMNQIVSSATSGNFVGVISGTINVFAGLYDTVASIFDHGAAKTRRLNKQINESKEEVRKLNMAYKDLERAVNKAMGAQETAAQRALLANKKLEKDEIERQLMLEQSKRGKDRDDDAIKQYQEQIQSLNHEIEDLGDSIVENLIGSNVKSAAEDFVDTWVGAWKEGENTLDAVQDKMDDVIKNIIKKAIASKIVGTLLQPFYDSVDRFASEASEGGVEITLNELKQLTDMANTLGISINDALGTLFGNLESLGVIDKGTGSSQLSALQQGIQGITEDTAGALEAYMNGVSQQVYLHSDLLTQIRDILVNFGGDVTIATNAQILLQLQQSFQVQMTIQTILQGWSNASGLAMRVELVS